MILRDRKNKAWAGRLTVGTALFLRDDLGVDVMAWIADWSVAQRDLADPSIVANAVYGILRHELQAAGVTDRQFGKLLKGQTHGDLVEAVFEELTRFVDVPELLPGKTGRGSKPTAASLWGSLWQAAGIAGVDPSGLTLGELICMADAKRKQGAMHTAMLCCAAFNSQGGDTKPATFDYTGFLGKADADEVFESIHEMGKAIGVEVKVRRVDGGQ